ncbi:MAG: right-handed parallel beta-helix repeat-containing protein [Myxococcota bacterium]|nr:right-handed parallel beta-helix repeat-containing protein [Myxococcota bacterium]
MTDCSDGHWRRSERPLPDPFAWRRDQCNTLMWSLTVGLFCLTAIGCQDSKHSSPSRDAALSDSHVNQLDQRGLDDARGPSSVYDGGRADQSFSAEDAQIPIADPLSLPIDDARIEGSHSRLPDGRILLDRGARAVFSIDDYEGRLHSKMVVVFRGQIWRFEDGLVDVGFGDTLQPALIQGDGLSTPTVITETYSLWRDPPSIDQRLPPRLEWSDIEAGINFTLVAREGGLLIEGIDFVDSRKADSVIARPPEVHETPIVDFVTCAEQNDCDDGARLTTLIAESGEQNLTIRLRSESYRGRTPVQIQRDGVHLIGRLDDESNRPIWNWDPNPELAQRWAFELRGQGITADGQFQLVEGIEAGQRRLTVHGRVPADVQWMRLTADDFGDVPPVCIGGRDVERANRHQRQLFRVLEVGIRENITEVVLDRPIQISIPASANPKVSVVNLLDDVSIENLELKANCPDALNHRFREANCENPGVIDDGGVLALYTNGVRLEAVHGQGFGKFTIEIRDALLSRVLGCSMAYPAAYGSGGQGYGVHLIGASRTVVHGQTVDSARHGVVVDFGSSDSQVLRGVFSNMNQALIDIHGEASRDTLVRGNRLSSGSIGVIVGGGGRTVHCNDGPRHHVIDNHMQDINIAGVSVTDYTHDVFVRSNIINDSSGHVIVSFGAQQVLIERNRLGEAAIASLALSFDDVRDVLVRRNLFTDICTEDASFLTVGAAESPTFEDNLFCPDIGDR